MRRWLLLGLFAACDGGRGPAEAFHELHDQGAICVRGAAPDASLPADQPLRVAYDAKECLSSSCTREPMATCAVAVAGQTVTITSHASWFDTSASATACTADCGSLAATCDTPPLPAGDYTFVFGTRTLAITLPSASQRCLE